VRAQPSARRVAERILADLTEEPTSAAEATALVRTAYESVVAAMSPIIGDTGIDAMFARSVRKGRGLHPCLEGVDVSDVGAALDRLWATLREQDPAAIKEIGVAVLAQFVELLSTLIGDQLTLQLFENASPNASALPSDEAERP